MSPVQASNEKSISIEELVYIIYFGIMFGARAIGLYEGMLLYNISLVVGMILFTFKILVTKHTILECGIITLLIGEALLVYINSGEKGILLYFTMMLGMKNVSRKKVEKFACILLCTSFIILTFLTSTTIIKDITFWTCRFPFNETLRHSLGYPVPNTLMTTYIILMILIFSTREFQSKKQLFCLTIFLGVVGVLLYIFSSSNTGIIVTFFYLTINLYFNCRKKISKVEKTVMYLTYPLCLFIAIPLPYITSKNEQLSSILHSFTHTRWGLSQYYLTNEKLSLFGSRFQEVISEGYTYMIDSSFLYSFLQVGIITFIIVTFFNLGMIFHHTRNENHNELAVILSLCLLGLSDPFLFNLSYKNIMFLYIGEWIWIIFQRYQRDWTWNKNIQIIKLNINDIFIPKLFDLKLLKQIINKNCDNILIAYLLNTLIISFAMCFFQWKTFIIGKVDTIPEWEYVRYNIAVGHWIGFILSFVIVIISASKIHNKKN